MKSFSEGAQASELRGITIITTEEDIKALKLGYQADRDLTVKRDVIPFKPPAKLTCLTTQSKEAGGITSRADTMKASCRL